jgi:hypothetical protein
MKSKRGWGVYGLLVFACFVCGLLPKCARTFFILDFT